MKLSNNHLLLFFLFAHIVLSTMYALRDFSDEQLVTLDAQVCFNQNAKYASWLLDTTDIMSTQTNEAALALQPADNVEKVVTQTNRAALTPKRKITNSLERQLAHIKPTSEKAMVIIIPSFNNSTCYQDNLDSVLHQHYKNYRVLYLDDASPDETGNLVEKYLMEKKHSVAVKLVKNETRRGAMANWYHAIQSCKDHEIVVMVDGDDKLAHNNVLSLLNKIYHNSNVWMTYGNFKKLLPEPTNQHRSAKIPPHIIKNNAFRDYPWVTSHLRTCYASLFKQIKQEDFMYEGTFYPVLCDHAFMFPMLEMAGFHSLFIPDILLIYNNSTPINDHKIHMEMILKFAKIIRSAKKYQPLDKLLSAEQ